MIIAFSQTASYWMQQYDRAVTDERYSDALRYVRKALATDTSFEVWFAYAELLYLVEQYDMSAYVCLRYGQRKMTPDQKKEWCRLMVDNANATANLAAVLHYDRILVEMDSEGELEELFEDFVDQLMQSIEGDEHKLQFSSQAHQEENRAVYDEMIKSYEREDYQGVLAMGENLHPDFDFYTECLFMLGKAQIALGDPKKGAATLRYMYEKGHHDTRILYHILDIDGALTPADLQQCLSMVDDSSKNNLAVGAMCAYRLGLDDLALSFALRAHHICPDDPECLFRVGAAYHNVGEIDKGAQYLRRGVNLYEDFFPVQLLSLPLPDRIDLTFVYTLKEWRLDLANWVDSCLQRDRLEVCMYTDEGFREAVCFLLTSEAIDPAWQAALAAKLEDWRGAEGNLFASDLLSSPTLPLKVRYHLIFKLLTQVGHGRMYMARRYVLDSFSLRLPPSFGVYSDKLKQAFAHAYCEMALLGKHSERKLCRLVERLYLKPPDFDYDPAILGFAIVLEGKLTPNNKLHDRLMSLGWDDEVFQYHWDAVKQAIKEE